MSVEIQINEMPLIVSGKPRKNPLTSLRMLTGEFVFKLLEDVPLLSNDIYLNESAVYADFLTLSPSNGFCSAICIKDTKRVKKVNSKIENLTVLLKEKKAALNEYQLDRLNKAMDGATKTCPCCNSVIYNEKNTLLLNTLRNALIAGYPEGLSKICCPKCSMENGYPFTVREYRVMDSINSKINNLKQKLKIAESKLVTELLQQDINKPQIILKVSTPSNINLTSNEKVKLARVAQWVDQFKLSEELMLRSA